MAIHKRGKKGFYSAYFRGLDERPDGTLVTVHREVCLHTTDAKTAAALDLQLRQREARHRAELRARAFARQLMAPDVSTPVSAVIPAKNERPRRLRLDSALDAAAKYADVGDTMRKVWTKFACAVGVVYMDQVTPEQVHAYLEQYTRGKTANNVRGVIGRVFKLTRMDSGLTSSPVDLVPRRKNDSEHQRPITEPEFLRLYAAAVDPWKTALLIGWHTGLRENDVASLTWDKLLLNFSKDAPVIKPGKTARFNRSVQVPIHPQLAAALAALPRDNAFVLGHWWPKGAVRVQDRATLAELFRDCGVCSNDTGLVKFNSLRDSFVTRMDAAGIPRHAIRGMVGHVSDDMTDLYSHDLQTALRILDLPPLPLSPSAQ